MSEIVKYERPSTPVLNPSTGELIDLGSPTDVLVRARMDAKEMVSMLMEYQRALDREVVDRMDDECVWTVHADGLVASAQSSAPVEKIDAEGLYKDLWNLVPDSLSSGAVDRAIELVPSYKISKRGLDALRKAGGVVLEVIERHTTRERPVDRRVTVKVDRS